MNATILFIERVLPAERVRPAEPVNVMTAASVRASRLCRFSLCVLLASPALISPLAQAAESMPQGAYRIITETGMPHLEENLRYATTRENRCLSHQELASAFPILNHESLKGCKLDKESRFEDTVSYLLSCEGGHGTTGTALWRIGEDQINGTLDVRLGGKNMTFYQRITAQPLGECVSAAGN